MRKKLFLLLPIVCLCGCLCGCALTLTTGMVKLDLELKEYARKPALDYVSSLLQKDTDDKENQQSVEPEPVAPTE